ncbi:hypothetical protein LTS03_004865 [Exophiala xenobiotica]|uniref:Dynactin subunit 4 n=1 Tax=Vermiconidia calcicola TaxID=1690605 RepID=A0AAV9Q8U8_9PEZI|nr:hypothetical protein LTR41_004955 [Exophiala xenobiotica]KAK5534805.1 hypothetical protein LTR23_008736 [Chaetothyriales sp. CCFEE 6169]KAK5535210.1 hypothetical protein LTR25_006218 [Vermiconidia calcicola]KAK5252284.1 hypothetical protein LTS06_003151 [Exophiala xenobiotica]KAK5281678.1 hypothetical protein LTR40_004457 [Exophiala xenobiotica]
MKIRLTLVILDQPFRSFLLSISFTAKNATISSVQDVCQKKSTPSIVHTACMITTSVGDSKEGPFILNCNHCMWNTLDIGIKFDKATGIRAQMDELANGGKPKPSTAKSPYSAHDQLSRQSSLSRPPFSPGEQFETPQVPDKTMPKPPTDATSRFNALKMFYKEQITESSATDAAFPTSTLDLAYSSPSSLQRIMSIYTNRESSMKRAREKFTIMREARTPSEGFRIANPPESFGYDKSITASQRAFQYPSFIGNANATKISDLRPMPTLMRTKRSKRCAACKHILTRPEIKISSARYRIKLIALNYIPYVTVVPLPASGGLPPPGPDGADIVLPASKPVQFIMTLRNPLFEDVSVSLGSPSVTPGKHGHRVTILCPQFQIGKNSDAWDDALNNPPNRGMVNSGGGEQIAGKLYDQGRNWVSIVLEIVPASIFRKQGEELDEDEDVIEIPVRVRLEWTVTDEDAAIERRKKEKVLDEGEDVDDGKRELSYWMVIGIGRVDC